MSGRRLCRSPEFPFVLCMRGLRSAILPPSGSLRIITSRAESNDDETDAIDRARFLFRLRESSLLARSTTTKRLLQNSLSPCPHPRPPAKATTTTTNLERQIYLKKKSCDFIRLFFHYREFKTQAGHGHCSLADDGTLAPPSVTQSWTSLSPAFVI